jgi:hypothetical protein
MMQEEAAETAHPRRMEQSDSMVDSPRRRHNLLRDKVQLRKRKDNNRYEIVPFPEPLSFEKGFFVVIRACQLLAQHNEGIIFVGVAGPSGAGKTVFTEKVVNLTPDVAVISMDNYNDATRIIDGNFDGTSPATSEFFLQLHFGATSFITFFFFFLEKNKFTLQFAYV